ncbi:hypothetical protein LCGC14_2999640, partial [marine sediment metagenome]
MTQDTKKKPDDANEERGACTGAELSDEERKALELWR